MANGLREKQFRETIKKYGRISWLCLAGAIGLGGYAIYSRNPVAASFAVVCFLGFYFAPKMPWFKKGEAKVPGVVSAKVETVDQLLGDRSPDTEPSEETGLTVVEPPESEQTQESAPPPE